MKADTILCRRTPAPLGAGQANVLLPSDDRSAEMLAKIPLGEDIAVKITRGRSLPHHRLLWAILSHVAESSQWETPERLLVALKIRLGRYDLMQLPNGKVVPVPDSISFQAMTQDAFAKFFDDAVNLICSEVIPGMDSTRLIEETQAAMGLRPISPEALVHNAGEAA